MIALQLSDDSISKEPRRQEIIDGLHDIPALIKSVLMMDKALQRLAKDTLAKEKSLLIMGRGYQCEWNLFSDLCCAYRVLIWCVRSRYLSRGCAKNQGTLLHALRRCECRTLSKAKD
jgi:hypothetical protein